MDATALRRGDSRLLLQNPFRKSFCGCHGLAPWRLTFIACNWPLSFSSKRESPRRKAVASAKPFSTYLLAASVKLHGARPWHPQNHSHVFVSRERESPRRKAVASISVFTQSR